MGDFAGDLAGDRGDLHSFKKLVSFLVYIVLICGDFYVFSFLFSRFILWFNLKRNFLLILNFYYLEKMFNLFFVKFFN